MTTQPTALRLADSQDCVTDDNCGYCMPCSVAAELRRLWAENEAIKAERDEDRRREYGYSQQVVDALTKERDVLRAQRDALLEALKELTGHINERFSGDVWDRARAAIKAVEENT